MPLPLADRKRDIAILISQGLSHGEIAEAQFTPSCSRVGAATRTELAQSSSTQFALPHLRHHRPSHALQRPVR